MRSSRRAALARDLRAVSSAERARSNRWFFKTGRGQYGEGDRFRGITVPALRTLARRYADLEMPDVLRLLKSPWHEERLLALLILAGQYMRGDERVRQTIHRTYLRHTRWVNNWDLVDASAAVLVGIHLSGRSRRPLYRLARSRNLWERRIAVIATFHYIRAYDFTDAVAISELLLDDDHDLIHKAVGWMLREIGKRDRGVLENVLRRHAHRMPRTMLRYAIEKFPEPLRRRYLARRAAPIAPGKRRAVSAR